MLLLDHCCHVAVVPAIEDHEFEIPIDGKFGRLTLGIGQPVDEVEPELGGLVVARPCDVLRSDDKVFSVTLFEFHLQIHPHEFPLYVENTVVLFALF